MLLLLTLTIATLLVGVSAANAQESHNLRKLPPKVGKT